MIYLNQLGMICSLGNRRENIGRRVLDAAQSGVTMIENYLPGRSLPLGRVEAAVPLAKSRRISPVRPQSQQSTRLGRVEPN